MSNKVIFKKLEEYSVTPIFDESEINQRYERGEKRLVTQKGSYSLMDIPNILGTRIDIKPDYQRNLVWTDLQKSKLIESFIMNIPVPPVFLYEVVYASYEVMDGLQRLTTIRSFYRDEFRLTGLEIWKELNGKCYSELPEKVKRGIDRRDISTIIILKETAETSEAEKELKQYVFERLNTGGTKLNDQEVRNAILDGPFNQFVKNVAETSDILREITVGSNEEFISEDGIRQDRMDNDELVLRFFAFRQISDNPEQSLKKILDLFLKEANSQIPNSEFEQLETIFNETLILARQIFGDKAYKLYSLNRSSNEYYWRSKFAKLIFDPVNVVLSEYVESQTYPIPVEGFENKLMEFFKENSENFNGRNTNKNSVEIRVKLFREFFEKNLIFN